MFARVLSGATLGVEAFLVDVEVHLEKGLPGFTIVGLPDSAVRESRERVMAAIKNSGFEFPIRKITVNLAPADIRKEGASFDLPMSLAILVATEQVAAPYLSTCVCIGELALDGSVRPVRGALPIALEARRRGLAALLLPAENAGEGGVVEGISVFPSPSLARSIQILTRESERRSPFVSHLVPDPHLLAPGEDLADVRGQEGVKRALEIAAAGGHNILMIGPPGSGKTMLARRLPGILPPLGRDEALETTRIHSVAGSLPPGTSLMASRPFRSPHHTISDAALVGGGLVPRPGEISLAHNGVLFLDELPEFARNALEVLRQPLEEGRVTINRTRCTVDYPARFMLVCAMNPCPCGNLTNPLKSCTCTAWGIQKYLSRVSGPLLDRIDLHIDVPPVRYKELSSRDVGEGSASIRERVASARLVQARRFKGTRGFFANAGMTTRDVREYCRTDHAGEELLRHAITRLGLSARAYDRILKVARTIADCSASSAIRPEHVAEAIQYRSLDRGCLGNPVA